MNHCFLRKISIWTSLHTWFVPDRGSKKVRAHVVTICKCTQTFVLNNKFCKAREREMIMEFNH